MKKLRKMGKARFRSRGAKIVVTPQSFFSETWIRVCHSMTSVLHYFLPFILHYLCQNAFFIYFSQIRTPKIRRFGVLSFHQKQF